MVLKGIKYLAMISDIVFTHRGTYPLCTKKHRLKKFDFECPKCGSPVIIVNPKTDQHYFLTIYSLNPDLASNFIMIAMDEEASRVLRKSLENADISKKTKKEKEAFEAQFAAYRFAEVLANDPEYKQHMQEYMGDEQELAKIQYCLNCGEEILPGGNFCVKCGEKVN